MNRGKLVTWLGVAVSAIGAVAQSPDVQSTVPPKYAAILALLGTVIAAAGPSVRKQKPAE
jgi:hypothetical protein